LRWNVNLESVKECSFNSSTASTTHESNTNSATIQKEEYVRKHKTLRRSSSHGDIDQILIETMGSNTEPKSENLHPKSINLNKLYINISSTSINQLNINFDQNNNGIQIGLEKRPELDIDSVNSLLEFVHSSLVCKFNLSTVYEKPKNPQKSFEMLENIQAIKSYLTKLEQFAKSD
jgi:hypothetical protein